MPEYKTLYKVIHVVGKKPTIGIIRCIQYNCYNLFELYLPEYSPDYWLLRAGDAIDFLEKNNSLLETYFEFRIHTIYAGIYYTEREAKAALAMHILCNS